jgi:methionyl aminopeptidase
MSRYDNQTVKGDPCAARSGPGPYDRVVIELRSATEIEAMRPAGRFVAEVLAALAPRVRPGVNLLELDRIAHGLIRDRSATSCYIDYHPSFGAMPFGKVLCTSVNDAVLHGLPFDYRLRDGDNVSLDFAAEVDGWVADSAITVLVGTPRPEDVAMVDVAERALAAGIAAAVAGNHIGDISSAIGNTINEAGYAVNTAFGGHGVGRTMHQRPDVPNAGEWGRGLRLQPGLVIAIEPWFLAGSGKIRMDKDGWTIRSADRTRGVHVEHTVAVTADGPLVLTDRTGLTQR